MLRLIPHSWPAAAETMAIKISAAHSIAHSLLEIFNIRFSKKISCRTAQARCRATFDSSYEGAIKKLFSD